MDKNLNAFQIEVYQGRACLGLVGADGFRCGKADAASYETYRMAMAEAKRYCEDFPQFAFIVSANGEG